MSLKSSCKPVIVALALTLASAGCTTIVRSSAPGVAAGPPAAALPFSGQAVSNDGRYVAFATAASNIVPGDTNHVFDVFRRDNATHVTTRVSLRDDGAQIPGGSFGLAISGNGDQVAFASDDSLEPADTNATTDIYVRTVSTGTTERVSIKPDGSPVFALNQNQALRRVSLSDDGRYALVTDTQPGAGHAYLRDLQTDTTTTLAELAADAFLAGGGQWIVENHLCTGGPCSFQSSLFSTDATTRETIDDGCGFEAYDVSADARYVVGRRFGVYPTFECPEPTGLVRWDRTTKGVTKVGIESNNVGGISISNNGRFVAVLDDASVLHVVDLQTGVSQIADTDAAGQRDTAPTLRAAISGSGRYVVIGTEAALTPDDGAFADTFTRYAITPSASGMTPSTVDRGASHVTIRVNGTELLPGATVAFPSGGVTVHSVTVVNPSRLDIDLSVDTGAPTGRTNAVVSNTGGFGASRALCTACLTIS